jgi:methanethiol S-methyltransferase
MLLDDWSALVMTVAHLFFAIITTAYILIAIRFEEAGLIAAHGENYRLYREQVPMIVPAFRSNITSQPETVARKVAAVN